MNPTIACRHKTERLAGKQLHRPASVIPLGLISFEEFHQTWKLLSSHLKMDITDKAIADLAQSIDFNKDGSIDINEFMEAFRLVDLSAHS